MRFPSYVVCFAIALLLSCSSLAAAAEQGEQASDKVARVGNLVITQMDVDRKTQEILPMQVGFHSSLNSEKIAEIKQKALDALVVRAYKVQYAIDEEISVDAALFESEWQKILGDNRQLRGQLQSPQMAKAKADLYLEMLARKAESIAVDDQIKVSEEEVSAYYTANKEKYFRPKLFTASHVFVKVDPADNEEEKEVKRSRAEALYKRALTGEDFYNLAYYESDDRSKYVGGSLGSFHAGQTVAEFDAAIQAMKPGEIVGPVRTMYGFHIIKLDAVEKERQLSFAEVSDKIRASLVDAQRKVLYENWMTRLKGQYAFERFSK